jgi:anaphase-promoting complex subunit 4
MTTPVQTQIQTQTLPKLPLLGTTPLSSPAAGGHLACNPAIDLTATVGEAGAALLVWRAGDQGLVSKCVERGKGVEAVAWKGDGEFSSILFLFFLTY